MELQINDQTIEHSYTGDALINDVINDVTEHLKKENQVICQIVVDDTIIPENKERETFLKPVGDITSLKLMADSIDNLVFNGLKSINNLIPELIRVLNDSAQKFRIGDTANANNLFASSLEALEIVPTILDGVRVTSGLDYSKIQHNNKTLSEIEIEMLTITKNISEAQSNNDYVHLADLLEYELIPNLSLWYEAIPTLEKSLQKKEEAE